LQSDIDHLRSYLDFGSGSALRALEPSIREALSDEVEQYIAYGQRALETFQKIKAMQGQIPKSAPKPKKQVFRGRNVAFPTRTYPVFYLEEMASDFTLSGWNWGFDLRDVSSDPDLSGKPTELKLALTEEGSYGRMTRFDGIADFRTDAQQYFSTDVTGDNFPLDLRGDLSAVGIGGFSGNIGFNANFSGGRGGAVAGGAGIDIKKPQLIEPQGTIAEVISEVLTEQNGVNLAVQYEHTPEGDDSFSIKTNIDNLIAAALRRAAERYIKQAQAAIEQALREKLSSYLDERWVSREDMDAILAAVRGDRAAVDRLKNSLDEKKNEAERRIRTAAEEAVNRTADEARSRAEESANKAIQNVIPGGIKLPF
jgi:DNA-directed RNA polymerase subunit L